MAKDAISHNRIVLAEGVEILLPEGYRLISFTPTGEPCATASAVTPIEHEVKPDEMSNFILKHTVFPFLP